MNSFLLILLGLVVGGIAGVLGGGMIGTGVGAGVGIVTGMQAGACLTVEAARDKGFITAEQVDKIFAAAAETLQGEAEKIRGDLGADAVFADSDAECQEVVAKLRQAAANQD